MSETNKYVWTNKGKEYSFDLDQLSPEEYTKFMKLKSNKAKERFIAAFQLYNSSYLPNEISLKSVVYPDYDDKTLSDIQLAAAKYNELKEYLSTDVGNETKQMSLKIKEVQDDILKHTNHITRQDMDTLLKFVPDMTVNQFLNYFNNLMNNKDLVVMNRIQKILKNPFDDEVLINSILNESDRFDEGLLKTLVDNDLRSAWANILANIKKYVRSDSARRQAYERAKAIIEKRVFKPMMKELKSINYDLTEDEFSEILKNKDLWESFIGPFLEANKEAAINKEIKSWRYGKNKASDEQKGLDELDKAANGDMGEEKSSNPLPNRSNMVNEVNNNQQNNLNQTLTTDDNPPEITDEDNDGDSNKDREDKLDEKIEDEAKKLDINISTPSKTRADVYNEIKQDEIANEVDRKAKEEEAKKKVKKLIGKQIDLAFNIVKNATPGTKYGILYRLPNGDFKNIPVGPIYSDDSNNETNENNAINQIYDVLKNHTDREFYITYFTDKWRTLHDVKNHSIQIITNEIRELMKNVGAGIFDRIRRKIIPSDIPKDIESMKIKLDSMKDLEKNLTMLKNENAKLSKELASLKEAVKALTDKTEKINYNTKYPGNIIKRDFLNDIPQKHNLRHVSDTFKSEEIIHNPDSVEAQLRRKMEERRKDIEPDSDEDSEDWGGRIKIKQSDTKMPIKFRRFIEEYLKMDESD